VQGLTGSRDVVRFEGFELDLRAGELRHQGGKTIRLAEQPFQILTMLLERPGDVVTREEVRTRLWANDTIVEFEHSISAAMNRLRLALGDSAESPRYIETLARRGYRWRTPVQWVKSTPLNLPAAVPANAPTGEESPAANADPRGLATPAATGPQASAVATGAAPAISTTSTPKEAVHELAQGAIKRRWLPIVGGAVVIVVIAVGTFSYFHRGPKLTEKDSIVLADFVNFTGDPVFDGSLREALAAKLDESPYFNIVPDAAIKQTLRLMKQRTDMPLTPELAREVCQRGVSGAVLGRGVSGAVLGGTISSIGNKYALTLRAMNCESGASLARIEVDADGKDNVLRALDKLASSMRGRLGESLASIEKFNMPIYQVTTSSLEALKAYSLGRRALSKVDFSSCVPFFQRAIVLDPNFAMAYAMLAAAYSNLEEDALSRENATRAFALHDSASEREKLYIDAHYYGMATGDLNKAAEVYQLWQQMYPRDSTPGNNLGTVYRDLGQLENAEQQFRNTPRYSIGTRSPFALTNLGDVYAMENRFDEAESVLEEGVREFPTASSFHVSLGLVAFARNDVAGMQRQVEWLRTTGREDEALLLEASPEAFLGKLRRSRKLVDQIISIAQQKRANGRAASAATREANAEALFGDLQQGRTYADRAISFQPDDAESGAVQALALSGESARAEMLLNQAVKKHPDDTLLNGIAFPVTRAILAMVRHDPKQALTILEPVQRYRLAPDSIYLYLRGLAYLQVKQGKEAAVEFQTILDHRGLFAFSPTYPLAQLGLARAYALQGDTVKARAAYKDFLTLWKDADTDVPILKQTKAEYAKLQ
jgi:DNA-binding winged helix-turn-helix (wHTH) protein/tetratricopeptide (TPR) repeat protein